jgi:hypothetical protein
LALALNFGPQQESLSAAHPLPNHHYIFDIDSFEDVIDFQNKTGFKIELPAKQ